MSQQMPDDNSLAKKMQALISSPQQTEAAPAAEALKADAPSNALVGIPRKNTPMQPPSASSEPPVDSGAQHPPTSTQPKAGSDATKPSGFGLSLDKEKILRALWTFTSVISMTVNVVVIIIVLIVLKYVPINTIKEAATNLPPGIGLNTPLDLLKGLYDNFELMDNAHITTDILVEDKIPVQFTLGINKETIVVLSEDVTISGARVALTTGGLNIFNAPATVVLPAGTNLPIILDLDVQVDEMIPVTLNVPVDIALNGTDLHKPFTGLQTVVAPLYCLVAPDAANAVGDEICSQEPAPAQ